MKTFHGLFAAIAVSSACLLSLATSAGAQSHRDVVAKSKDMVPSPPWSKGDQVGMAKPTKPWPNSGMETILQIP